MIGPIVGQTASYVKNSKEFVGQIRNEIVGEDQVMVSFDVKSLFTNVPLDEALQVIRERLSSDDSLSERTGLPPDSLIRLLELFVRSTHFTFQGQVYEQTEGAAMGSPVSPVVANIYMGHFEDQALTTAPNPPPIWKRYVDDIFCILKKGTIQRTLNHLNNIHPAIQFTVEVEKDGMLPFFDTQLQRGQEGTLDTTVFHKTTHTDRYLQFESHHPVHVKRGVVKSLFDRVQAVILKEENMYEEKNHLENALQDNGYPRPFIQRSLERQRARWREATPPNHCDHFLYSQDK